MSEIVKRPIIEPHNLESICKTIAATDEGLKGSEIRKLLADSQIKDTYPDITKWQRLYNAFVGSQNNIQCSNNVLNFLKAAMQPARYLGMDTLYLSRLHELNKRLSFIGVEITDRGTLRPVDTAVTLLEAQQRASHFKYKLQARNSHPEIFKYCGPELLAENYFHSVFEGVKSIADRIRGITGLHADGNPLVETAFSTNNPLIRINLLQNDNDRSEHLGLCNLIKGLFGLIRNPTAHVPKINFIIEEDEALDTMTTISLVHKKLDKAL